MRDIGEINAHLIGLYKDSYERNFSLDTLFDIICDVRGVSIEDVMFKNRKRPLVETRHLFYYFAFKYTLFTMSDIGIYLSSPSNPDGYDHSTVLHGINLAKELIEINYFSKKMINDIEIRLDDMGYRITYRTHSKREL